jgi:alkylation response protein AidB-like acyl-CoA dehydrogenase
MSDVLERVRVVADEVLFPAALEVDRSGVIPASHWDRLAAEGMYGLAAPPDLGGPGLQLPEIIEGLTSGRIRSGVAFAGVIPDPPRMRAARTADGWRLSGDAPFVSGWGIVQRLQVSAGDVETGDVLAVVVEAREQPGITSIERQSLVAADATNTVSLRLDDLVVTDDRVVSRAPRAEFLANQIFAARINGTLPIGLVTRCCRLLEEAGQGEAADRIRTERDIVRDRLDAGLADVRAMVAARADGAQLALRAAAALVTAGGGPSLVETSHAQRLAREAVFTLVAASRAELKRELLVRFSP